MEQLAAGRKRCRPWVNIDIREDSKWSNIAQSYNPQVPQSRSGYSCSFFPHRPHGAGSGSTMNPCSMPAQSCLAALFGYRLADLVPQHRTIRLLLSRFDGTRCVTFGWTHHRVMPFLGHRKSAEFSSQICQEQGFGLRLVGAKEVWPNFLVPLVGT